MVLEGTTGNPNKRGRMQEFYPAKMTKYEVALPDEFQKANLPENARTTIYSIEEWKKFRKAVFDSLKSEIVANYGEEFEGVIEKFLNDESYKSYPLDAIRNVIRFYHSEVHEQKINEIVYKIHDAMNLAYSNYPLS